MDRANYVLIGTLGRGGRYFDDKRGNAPAAFATEAHPIDREAGCEQPQPALQTGPANATVPPTRQAEANAFPDRDRKRFETLRAKLALSGLELRHVSKDGGSVTYYEVRSSSGAHTCTTLHGVEGVLASQHGGAR